ncbi:nucleoside monophosphate kinase [Candidatus Uhrbacteria bacterium]|nr:nucleoside monophosphate kinase [Candidatus Uhrbacteria bacterium]
MARVRLRALLFGPHGAGKTTQGQLLAERYGVPFVSSGNVLRAEIAEKTAIGKMVEDYVEAGMLAPDELVDAIVLKRLKGLAMERGYVLDGFPRNVEQAVALDKLLKPNLAIQLKLPDATALKRLTGRLVCEKCRSVFHRDFVIANMTCAVCRGKLAPRKDDAGDTARLRLAVYHFMTEPLAAHYRQRGLLLAVNADQSIEDLHEELCKKSQKLGFT